MPTETGLPRRFAPRNQHVFAHHDERKYLSVIRLAGNDGCQLPFQGSQPLRQDGGNDERDGVTDCHGQFSNWSRNDENRYIGARNNDIGPVSAPHPSRRLWETHRDTFPQGKAVRAAGTRERFATLASLGGSWRAAPDEGHLRKQMMDRRFIQLISAFVHRGIDVHHNE